MTDRYPSHSPTFSLSDHPSSSALQRNEHPLQPPCQIFSNVQQAGGSTAGNNNKEHIRARRRTMNPTSKSFNPSKISISNFEIAPGSSNPQQQQHHQGQQLNPQAPDFVANDLAQLSRSLDLGQNLAPGELSYVKLMFDNRSQALTFQQTSVWTCSMLDGRKYRPPSPKLATSFEI